MKNPKNHIYILLIQAGFSRNDGFTVIKWQIYKATKVLTKEKKITRKHLNQMSPKELFVHHIYPTLHTHTQKKVFLHIQFSS